MKLVHPDFFFPIEISETEISLLVLENPVCFRNFIREIREQMDGMEGQWVLSEDNKLLKIAKTCELILDPFGLDINQKKVLTSLYDRVEKYVTSSDLLQFWNQAESDFQKVTETLLSVSDEFVLINRNDISVVDFLRFMDVRFEKNTDDTIEYMIDYMRILAQTVGTRLFVLCNMKLFFNGQEIGYLYEQAMYHKFYLLLVEGSVPIQKEKREKLLIIDKDNCVIMPSSV